MPENHAKLDDNDYRLDHGIRFDLCLYCLL